MKKDKKYLTIQERREYLISGKPMPLSFNPIIKDKKKSDRKYVSTLISGGDSSLIVKVKKGTRMLIGSGEHATLDTIGKNKSKVLKLKK